MRIGLVQGMHTDMPIANLGEPLVQRCRKIWWTIYILDRYMTSLMGLPQSIRDEDISCRLPDFRGSPQRVAALNMQIKLARVHTEVASSTLSYGRLFLLLLLTGCFPASCVWLQRTITQEVCREYQSCTGQFSRAS